MLARSSLNTEILHVFKDILRRCIAEEASQADRGRLAEWGALLLGCQRPAVPSAGRAFLLLLRVWSLRTQVNLRPDISGAIWRPRVDKGDICIVIMAVVHHTTEQSQVLPRPKTKRNLIHWIKCIFNVFILIITSTAFISPCLHESFKMKELCTFRTFSIGTNNSTLFIADPHTQALKGKECCQVK